MPSTSPTFVAPFLLGSSVLTPRVGCSLSASPFAARRLRAQPRRVAAQRRFVVKSEDGQFDPSEIGQALVTQVKQIPSRPVFYGALTFSFTVAIVTLKVASSLLAALDEFPLVPDTLRLIGLGYTAWFVWKYLLYVESRDKLVDKVNSTIDRIKWN